MVFTNKYCMPGNSKGEGGGVWTSLRNEPRRDVNCGIKMCIYYIQTVFTTFMLNIIDIYFAQFRNVNVVLI